MEYLANNINRNVVVLVYAAEPLSDKPELLVTKLINTILSKCWTLDYQYSFFRFKATEYFRTLSDNFLSFERYDWLFHLLLRQ